ncbi:MAG: alpha-amylase family glycosyl hydrolase [Deltaproteobacteria bacterium]
MSSKSALIVFVTFLGCAPAEEALVPTEASPSEVEPTPVPTFDPVDATTFTAVGDPKGTIPPAPPRREVPFEEWRHREPIYELYVRHFSEAGNFKGVEARLPELKTLGVGIVWLLPVNAIGSIVAANGGEAIDAPFGNPYAIKRYDQLNPEYGSDGTEASAAEDLIDLVNAAHALDMRVIVDWVPNHTAWDNPLIDEHPEWYARDEAGNIRSVGEQFRWIAQLDWSNRDLWRWMREQMVAFRERFDIDGFRIDFAHHMPIEFFRELRPALEVDRPVFLLAEAHGREYHPVFDMTYDWSVYPRLGDVAHGHQPVTTIDDALYFDQFVPYLDAPEALSMRMTYNHDDNGVWTLQDRYREGIRTFAVLACTLPGKPLIFDGQEAGMRVRVNGEVLDSAPLTHDPAVKLDWSDPEGYRPFYTKLLQLFRANPALHHVGFDDFRKIDTAPAEHAYAYVRRDGDDAVLVVLNLSPQHLSAVRLEPSENAGSIDGDYVELFSEEPVTVRGGDVFELEPWAYRVFVRGPRDAT